MALSVNRVPTIVHLVDSMYYHMPQGIPKEADEIKRWADSDYKNSYIQDRVPY